jgi:hypothetical protein
MAMCFLCPGDDGGRTQVCDTRQFQTVSHLHEKLTYGHGDRHVYSHQPRIQNGDLDGHGPTMVGTPGITDNFPTFCPGFQLQDSQLSRNLVLPTYFWFSFPWHLSLEVSDGPKK